METFGDSPHKQGIYWLITYYYKVTKSLKSLALLHIQGSKREFEKSTE